jgi:hypothetical protein
VRPGVTGLAQVRGRNGLTWEEKFAADVEYVDGLGPLLDARILLTTLRIVLRRQGISAPGAATMHLFTGTTPAGAPEPGDAARRDDAGRTEADRTDAA